MASFITPIFEVGPDKTKSDAQIRKGCQSVEWL